MTINSTRYSFEVIAADEAARSRVIDDSQIMGVAGRNFLCGTSSTILMRRRSLP